MSTARHRERALLEDGREVAAADQGHLDEQPAVDLAVVVDRHDVGCAGASGERGLAAEAGLELLVGGELEAQPLRGDGAALPGVDRSVHLAMPPSAEQLHQHVRAELLVRHASISSLVLWGRPGWTGPRRGARTASR
jgi:hypothetical protein|nr:hypothetical protein [Pseudonocardia thermophila]